MTPDPGQVGRGVGRPAPRTGRAPPCMVKATLHYSYISNMEVWTNGNQIVHAVIINNLAAIQSTTIKVLLEFKGSRKLVDEIAPFAPVN